MSVHPLAGKPLKLSVRKRVAYLLVAVAAAAVVVAATAPPSGRAEEVSTHPRPSRARGWRPITTIQSGVGYVGPASAHLQGKWAASIG